MSKNKKRRGRPKVVNKLKKRVIRATDAQWARWGKVAGRNRSRWIRQVLDRAAAK